MRVLQLLLLLLQVNLYVYGVWYFRQKSRAGVQGAPALSAAVQVKGPDEEKIKQILARTGYTLDVTTGQYALHSDPADNLN